MFFVSAFLVLAACESETKIETKNVEETRSNLAAGSASEEEIKEAAEKRRAELQRKEEERMQNTTTMEILPNNHDFGLIPKGKPVSKVFEIKNTGDKPLIINDAKASCGCTVPKKPEEPIMPGDSGELEVTFTSNPGQEGQTIRKTVTVTANILESTNTISITGKVSE